MPIVLPETGKASSGAGDFGLDYRGAEEQVAHESRGKTCITHQRRQLRPMALAVEERMNRDLAPRNASQLRRHPIHVENARLIPAFVRSRQQSGKDLRCSLVEFEQRIERTSRNIFLRRYG